MKKNDKQLSIKTNIRKEGLQFFDVQQEPFRIYGGAWENGMFRRMPEEVAKSVNEGVYSRHSHGSGGRVRFITDSPYVAIQTEYIPGKMSEFALTGSAGFDMYAGRGEESQYMGTFIPPLDVENGYESVIDFDECKERDITINLPLYSSVKKLYIGLKEGCTLKAASEYHVKKPVVYYGSSITHGAFASKPGSSYESILSRRFDCDYINLGFGASARGEKEIVDYIKGLDMSVFVLDYDHNAPDTEHLEKTHNKMFKAIRSAHPNLPIVIMPRPKFYLTADEKARYEIVYNTYLKAKEAGDENVYFISGKKLMELVGDNGTVDNCHPTDSGFFSMAYAITKVFEKILV